MSALLPLAGSTWSCHDEIRCAKLRGLLNDNPQYERELMRPKPSAQVVTWVAQQPGTKLFTTSIGEAEIFTKLSFSAEGSVEKGCWPRLKECLAKTLRDAFSSLTAMQQECSPR